MSSTNYAKNKNQDLNFGGISFTPPANFYLALSTTSISSSGSNITEPTGAGYARVLIPNTKSYFTYSTSGCVTNSGSIAFATSSGSFGTIVDIALMDSLTTGSAWFYTTLPTPINIQMNTALSFSASALVISQT
jgi:hypothetical protein